MPITENESEALKLKIIMELLDNEKKMATEDDRIFRDRITGEITNRDNQYTRLLSHFVNITILRNYLKEFFKWSFYLAVISSLFLLIKEISSLSEAFIAKADIQQLIEAIPLFITSIVGLVSAIIAIPIAITKYLFSTKEDKNITDIILHTQEHDTSGRQWTLDFQKISDEIKEHKKKDTSAVQREEESA